ncbi:MAG: bifunctional homocysteine S-methyltransferase/methylenetetrahydrofolate reductase [Anaerolineae bacterium]|jgi:homocysteine S-methyltransferase|nr:bifunctional homocysteine S-methyltransferase/methylenetetrahydrofolate reductase [Anaerolineae bacterium]
MKDNRFLKLLESSPLPVLRDGAMGTLLHSRGVGFESCFDALNLSNPALVGEIHRAYIDAGAQMLQTNTFGANRYKLAAHGMESHVAEINRAGVDLARRVIHASFKDVLVAGDVGPLGVRLAPFGRVQLEDARTAFVEQIAALAAAGVDVISLETFTDLYEIREAVAAARQVCDLPVIASMTFTRDDRTLLGDGPEKVARALVEIGAEAIGVNCSGGPAQLQRILQRMKLAAPEARLSAGPNAGWPEQVAGRIMYPATADYFAEYAFAFRQIGVALIGGCCGTTPEHIAAMRRALDAPPGPEVELAVLRHLDPEPSENGATPPTRLAEKFAAGKFVVAVEMDPPHTISSHKLLAGASLLADVGVDVINVADSPMARMRMSPWAVCHLIQKEVGMETVLHFPTRGRNLLRVQGDLLAAHTLGIRNVFVVMGDPTAIGDYPEAMDNYDLAPSGLIQLIKEKLNAGRDHAGSDIGRPTAFFVGGALNLDPPEPEREIKVLRRKLRNGVDFLLTQPVFQPERAAAFVERYAAEYGPLPVPVLAGILPLNNLRHARFLHNEVPGIIICPEIFERLERADKESAHEGVLIAAELMEQVRPWASGVYIMPAFSRYDLAAEVAEAALRL